MYKISIAKIFVHLIFPYFPCVINNSKHFVTESKLKLEYIRLFMKN